MTRRGWILFLSMGLIWGIPYLLIKVAVGDLNPITLVFLRTLLGAVLLLPLAAARGGLRPLLPRWKFVVAYTLAEVALPWVLLSDAERHLTSSLTGLLIAAVPFVGVILSWLTGAADRFDARRLAGLVIGFVGVAALVGLNVSGSDVTAVGELGLVAIGYAVEMTIVSVLFLGWLLIIFGMRWLRKAILRAAGAISMHDEMSAFEQQKQQLQDANSSSGRGLDVVGFLASFKAVTLEGLEVVFIVIAVGATANALIPASVGAAAAGVLVVAAGIALQRPLSHVPENSLKLVVGVMLSAFGTFWIGEGLGMKWIGEDLAILGLIVGYLVISVASIALSRRLESTRVAEVRVSQT